MCRSMWSFLLSFYECFLHRITYETGDELADDILRASRLFVHQESHELCQYVTQLMTLDFRSIIFISLSICTYSPTFRYSVRVYIYLAIYLLLKVLNTCWRLYVYLKLRIGGFHCGILTLKLILNFITETHNWNVPATL